MPGVREALVCSCGPSIPLVRWEVNEDRRVGLMFQDAVQQQRQGSCHKDTLEGERRPPRAGLCFSRAHILSSDTQTQIQISKYFLKTFSKYQHVLKSWCLCSDKHCVWERHDSAPCSGDNISKRGTVKELGPSYTPRIPSPRSWDQTYSKVRAFWLWNAHSLYWLSTSV